TQPWRPVGACLPLLRARAYRTAIAPARTIREQCCDAHGDEGPGHCSFAGGAEAGTRGPRQARSYRRSLASMRSQIMAATSGPPKFFTARMPVGEVTLI